MAPATQERACFTIRLNSEERSQILTLLEQTLRDTHSEARRTEAPDYQEKIHQQEATLRGLIDKLQHAQA